MRSRSQWAVGLKGDGGEVATRNGSFPTLSKHKYKNLGYERDKRHSILLGGILILYIIILCSSVVSDDITVITTIKIDGCNDSRILSMRTTTVSNKNIISLYYTLVYRIITTRERNPRPGHRCCCPAKRKTSRFRARRVHIPLLSP